MKKTLLVALCATSAAVAAPGGVGVVAPGGVAGSKHDLSVTGPGPIKAVSETRVCIFCHVAHGSAPATALSNRPDIGASHRSYESTTMATAPGAPSGASRLCLSCHDGTIAVGQTRRGRIETVGTGTNGSIPPSRRSHLGTDLRKTHPVSFAPRSAEKIRRSREGVRLDRNGEMQCTSCHDAHSEFGGTPEGKFLLVTTHRSRLCAACHDADDRSAHASSAEKYDAAQGNAEGYASVGEAGCAACHVSHGADERGRLLAKRSEETADALCLRCHRGPTARVDIGADVAKPYSHVVNPERHDASEGPGNAVHRLPETSAGMPRHASCCDCHDPHLSSKQRASAPDAGGALAGSWGIDADGRRVAPARFQYEVCFKCHGDSANARQGALPALGAPRRSLDEPNLRLVLGTTAASYHPVLGPGRNANVPSLRAPYSPSSVVYCTDCHSSDSGPGAGGAGARGPHGSIYPALLERNYTTGDLVPESPLAYALCYKCHDRDVLLSRRSGFPLHSSHVVLQRTPCSVCHASHGVAGPGADPSANAHLIDFDLSVVRAPRRAYEAQGAGSGSCTLVCHGHTHDGSRYAPGL